MSNGWIIVNCQDLIKILGCRTCFKKIEKMPTLFLFVHEEMKNTLILLNLSSERTCVVVSIILFVSTSVQLLIDPFYYEKNT